MIKRLVVNWPFKLDALIAHPCVLLLDWSGDPQNDIVLDTETMFWYFIDCKHFKSIERETLLKLTVFEECWPHDPFQIYVYRLGRSQLLDLRWLVMSRTSWRADYPSKIRFKTAPSSSKKELTKCKQKCEICSLSARNRNHKKRESNSKI